MSAVPAETRTFRGETLPATLRQVREELGSEAIVVRQREGVVGGVGGFFGKRCVEVEVEVPCEPSVVAPLPLPPRMLIDLYDSGGEVEPEAYDPTDEEPAGEEPAEENPLMATLLEQSAPFAAHLAARLDTEPAEPVEPHEVESAMPADPHEAEPAVPAEPHETEPESSEVLATVGPEASLPEPATPPPAPLEPDVYDPEATLCRLTAAGLDARLAREVVSEAESELRLFDPTEPFEQQVRTMLARRIRVRGSGRARRRVIAVVGTAGAGKTLTAARLCHAHRTGAGRSVAALSLEPMRKALELGRRTDEYDIELAAADEPRILNLALERVASAEVLVVDTPAIDPHDDGRLRALEKLLELVAPDETHLLVPATLDANGVAGLLKTVARRLSVNRLLLTHVDGPGSAGALVSASIRSRLPISFTTTGGHWGLRPAEPCELARLVLP